MKNRDGEVSRAPGISVPIRPRVTSPVYVRMRLCGLEDTKEKFVAHTSTRRLAHLLLLQDFVHCDSAGLAARHRLVQEPECTRVREYKHTDIRDIGGEAALIHNRARAQQGTP